ncbi:MAG TPA: PEP-CTERM sorting domain-containing protein [Roseateles sp.]
MVFTSLSSRPGHRLRSLLGACLLAVASGASHAGVGLVWDMSNWHLSATPSQTLELHATVYNEASATEHLLGSRFVAAFGEGIEDAYDFVGPLVSVAEQFALLDLAPGQSMDFVFGRLVPVGGKLAPGDYMGGGFALTFRDQNGAAVSWTPEHTLMVTVADGAPTSDLPEPASLALALSCLGALALQRRRVSAPSRRCR